MTLSPGWTAFLVGGVVGLFVAGCIEVIKEWVRTR